MNFEKYADGLIPAIIQDNETGKVLMLGFMNQEALTKTESTGRVTFFSRTKQRLWTKGEESGNFLQVVSITGDCDDDTYLIKVNPVGPVCHTGADTCFNESNQPDILDKLESTIGLRYNDRAGAYTSTLFDKGINTIAQKVGEEAVELVIESKDNDPGKFINEAADLLFHYLVLLKAKGHTLNDVKDTLRARHAEKK